MAAGAGGEAEVVLLGTFQKPARVLRGRQCRGELYKRVLTTLTTTVALNVDLKTSAPSIAPYFKIHVRVK